MSIDGKQEGIHMKISREQNVINHLQREQKQNMNLLFYDFNGSSALEERSKTGQNFYPRKNPHQEEGNAAGGMRDRLPTRDSKSRDVGRRSLISNS